MKSILVALDGSPASMDGLTVAVHWAEKLNARLKGVFVEDERRFMHYPASGAFDGGVPHPVPLPEGALKEETARVEAEKAEISRAFEKEAKGRVKEARFSSLRGDVAHLLTQSARGSDLVVVGKRGRNDPPDSNQAGPTVEALIHDALRPVLVVPEKPRTTGPVLFAYDGSSGVQRVIVPGTLLAAAGGQGILALTVDREAERGAGLQGMLREYLEPYGIEVRFDVQPGIPLQAILEAAEAEQAGMIVMGAFGHGAIRQILFGSTTLDVVERAPCPVLLMA